MSCENLRLPRFLDNRLTDGCEVVTFTRRPRSSPQKYLMVLMSAKDRVNSRVIVRLEVLGKLKKFSYLIGTQTCNLPACSIEPQPTILRRLFLDQ
jgi:hypothetical protein